jgi:hypothetical protein
VADNVTLNPGSGGATLATDDISGTHYQIIKIAHGGSDSATLVSTSSGLPVDLRTNNLGTNINVVVASALPAGTNNIGDVDVLSVVPGTGATDLGKAEDGAHTSGDVGVMALAVRTDSPANRSGADGDYEPLQVSAGRLWVSATVTSALVAGNNNIGDVDVASLPATALAAGNLVHVDYDSGGGTQNMPMVGLALPASGGAVAGGTSTNPLRMDPTGTTTQPVSDAGGSLTVDGSVSISGTATVQSNASLVDDAAFTPATSRVVMVGAELDDTSPDSVDEGDGGALRMSANRNLYTQIRDLSAERSAAVTAANALKVDNSAVTQPVSGTVTANAGTGSFTSAGDVASDAADSGNPVKVGGQARTTLPTAVADADRVNFIADDLGRQVVMPFAPRDLIVHNRISLTSTTETTLISAGGAGVFRDLLFVILSNESASEVRVDIRDATGGTVRLSVDLAADGGGAVVKLPVPLTQATANNAWSAQLSAAVSTVYITAICINQN